MKDDFPLEAECCICNKYKLCAIRDDDFQAPVCHECLPDIIFANEVIIDDLMKCGILI